MKDFSVFKKIKNSLKRFINNKIINIKILINMILKHIF